MILDMEKWLFFYDQIYKMNVPIKNWIIEECKKSKKQFDTPCWNGMLQICHTHTYIKVDLSISFKRARKFQINLSEFK